jgi:dihydroflavonol-4-reductase
MKALVTGGTGFVGSHIVRRLLEGGHSVRVLHRATSKLTALDGLTYESFIGDLDDLEALRAACDGMDWVFHVAAVADYWRSKPDRIYETNVEGTRRVLQAAKQAGVRRVVFTSSASAVGLRDEREHRPADETEPFNLPPDFFPYAHSKVLAEQVVAEAVEAGQDVVIVNPVVVMGPGDLNMISGRFVTEIKRLGMLVPVTSGGVAVVDVRDVARWHVLAAEQGRTGERYILGTANFPLRTWFDMIADAVGVRRPFLPLPNFVVPIIAYGVALARKLGIPTPVDPTQTRMSVRKIYFDYSKAWGEFGPPQIDMEQSLRDTVAWYQEQGVI